MKRNLLSVLFCFYIVASYGITDTLRHYNVAIGSRGYNYNMATYPKQFARFEPKAPGYINKVIITLNGPAGSCRMRILGHDGGSPYPFLQKDIMTPVTVNKTTGLRKVIVTLASPLFVDNNEFYIMLENFSANVSLVTDTITHLNCTSSLGGDMYYQFLENSIGEPGSGNSAFAIDIIMDYPFGVVSPQLFRNISTSSGIGTNLSNMTISWSDIDKDGFLDLLVAGKLFKNNKDTTFTDITTSAGITTPFFRNTFIDMNNDGKDDILFLSSVKADNAVYINNGNSTFTKQPLTFVPDFDNISTLSIADLNNDKFPDLFVGQLRDVNSIAEPNFYFVNDKNLGFIDSTVKFPAPVRETRGSMFVDYDDDGDLDLYVSNYRNAPDEFWQNNGDGSFTNIASVKGLDVNTVGRTSNHGSGCDWSDYDNDGYMDLLLPNLCHSENLNAGFSPTTLYKNSGPPDYNFSDTKATNGIQYEETHAGAHWGDVNSDGLQDIFISAFYSCRYSDLYLQKPDNSFELKSWEYGIQNVSGETDGVLVDMNNDGKLDLACGDNSYFFRLFSNNGNYGNNYVSIDLTGVTCNAMAIGAKVVVYAGGKKYTQYQIPNHGALMNKSNRLFFGLGTASTVDKVVVNWPSGTTVNSEEFTNITINSINSIVEGSGSIINSLSDPLRLLSDLTVYPNPFSDQVNFTYNLMKEAHVSIEIYSVLGERVAMLVSEKQAGGKHTIIWDGKGLSGTKLAHGIYTYRIITGQSEKNGLISIVN